MEEAFATAAMPFCPCNVGVNKRRLMLIVEI
jgi:hypothetical protein